MRHVRFAIGLILAIIISLVLLIPLVAGDCGASTVGNRALYACVDAQRREFWLYVIIWVIALGHAVWQHARNTTHVPAALAMLALLPMVGSTILAKVQADEWESLDRAS